MCVRSSPRIARRHRALVSRSRDAISASANPIRDRRASAWVFVAARRSPRRAQDPHATLRPALGANAYSLRPDRCDHIRNSGRALGEPQASEEPSSNTRRRSALARPASKRSRILRSQSNTAGSACRGGHRRSHSSRRRPRGPSCPGRPSARGALLHIELFEKQQIRPGRSRSAACPSAPCPDLRQIAGRSCRAPRASAESRPAVARAGSRLDFRLAVGDRAQDNGSRREPGSHRLRLPCCWVRLSPRAVRAWRSDGERPGPIRDSRPSPDCGCWRRNRRECDGRNEQDDDYEDRQANPMSGRLPIVLAARFRRRHGRRLRNAEQATNEAESRRCGARPRRRRKAERLDVGDAHGSRIGTDKPTHEGLVGKSASFPCSRSCSEATETLVCRETSASDTWRVHELPAAPCRSLLFPFAKNLLSH